MPPAYLSFVRRHPAHVVRVLPPYIRVQVLPRPAHPVALPLVPTEDYRLGEPVRALEEVGQVTSDSFRAGTQRDHPFEVPGVVILVRDLAPEAIQLALARAPPGCVHARHYPVDAVRRQETVLDALLQAVLVDGVPEIAVGCLVVCPQRRGRHTELVCWL